jgi:hypothetical protein
LLRGRVELYEIIKAPAVAGAFGAERHYPVVSFI